MRICDCLLPVLGWITCEAAFLARADESISVGDRLELFVDRHVIDALDGTELRLHEPEKQPRPNSPLVGSYATVIRDGDLYRAYYRDKVPSYDGPLNSGHPGEITCYAESRDGHEWTFPKLGLYEVDGSRDNNVILYGQSPFSHDFSPFLDARPGVDRKERFKALAGHGKRGLWAFVSTDGIHWQKVGEAPVIPYQATWSHAFDSQNVAFWSEAEGCYVSYFRTWETPHGKLRTISRATSADFRRWKTPVAMNPNLPGEHLYTNQTHPYFRAPHLYVALPTRYQAGRGSSTDILFMSSRAGSTTYDRLFTEAFIRPGLDPERFTNRANYVALNVVPTGPAEMSIYHAKSGHRYTLRTDGFVSVRAGAAPGEMRTKPVTFSGKRLVLNYGTSAAGVVQVELQLADGTPIPGFRLKDCPPIVGDAIEHVVRWKSGADVSSLSGQPIRLRFLMQEADLFSFRFADE